MYVSKYVSNVVRNTFVTYRVVNKMYMSQLGGRVFATHAKKE